MEQIIFRLYELGNLYAGGDAPKDVSSERTNDYCYPIYSNGLENEGLYGFCKKATMKANTITVSARGTIGAAFYRKEPFLPIVRLITIEPNDEKVDRWYLYYYLQMNKLEGYGTSQQQLTLPFMKKKKLLIYKDVLYQQKIASILHNYDLLIENNNKRIKILENMAESIFKEWFVRLRFPGFENAKFENGIPDEWKINELKDFGISLISGSRPKGGIDDSLKDGVPSFGAEVIGDLGSFDFGNVKYIPFDYYEKMKRGKNTGNDILLYKDGAYIGKITMFKYGYPFDKYCINEHVFFIEPNNQIYKNFLYFTLHQKEMFSLMQILNRNAAQPGLSQEDVSRIKIRIPSKDVIEQFNTIINPILNSIFKYAKQNSILSQQRDSLLPRLMSGKLEVKC